ncbi:MAG: aspartate/glutamate racemase family protein [Christensenella sp.]|nr:aspartate/glutamate racemase family protein [Christensenella sp.]
MKYLNLIPVPNQELAKEISGAMKGAESLGTTLDMAVVDYGPASIEGEYDEALASAAILDTCAKAGQYDGVFINCFGDPGVRAAREFLGVPVFGGFEPPILLALGLADKIGVVTVLKHVVPMIKGNIKKAGWEDRVPSVRVVNIPVLDLDKADSLIDAIAEEAKNAIEQDGVEAIVLGCTGMAGATDKVHAYLSDAGYDVPVVDPTLAAVKLLEVYGALGLKPSRLTYMPIREKERK